MELIASDLNNFFVDVGKNLCDQILEVPQNYAHYLGDKLPCNFSFGEMTSWGCTQQLVFRTSDFRKRKCSLKFRKDYLKHCQNLLLRSLSFDLTRQRNGHNKLLVRLQQCSQCDITQIQKLHIFPITSASNKRIIKPITFRNKSRIDKIVDIWKNMTVLQLAQALDKTVDEIYEIFIYVEDSEAYDKPSSIIDNLNVIHKTVKLSGMRYKHSPPPKTIVKENKDAVKRPPTEVDLVPRPPVVTIMGHVDHGKTTLLDSLRHSAIVDSEFGGITQHIGAFEVRLISGELVTFLDTPGHAAFSAMRARGTLVTDLIVLVVAADDGVLPQTKECINLAKEASIPVIIAINKIDKQDADVPRVKEMLLHAGLQLEEQGGEVQSIEISALKGINIAGLVEALVTQAEVLSLKADPKGMFEGTVIESNVDIHRGKTTTCIVQRGTLRKGAVLVAGTAYAKVRSLFNDLGKTIDKAPPGTPVQVIGWRELPSAGDEVLEVESERRANEVIAWRKEQEKEAKDSQDIVVIKNKFEEHQLKYQEQRQAKLERGIRYKMYKRPPLEKQFKHDPRPHMSLVLKGDVDGSLEAIMDVLETYQSDICPLNILSYGVGGVSPSDVELANAFNGCVYAFNTTISSEAKSLAKKHGVPIKEYNIIYRLVENLKNDISVKLPPLPCEEIIGQAEVQAEFHASEGNTKVPVAGCRCISGSLKKDETFRLVRTGEIIHEGKVHSMRHFKKEVTTVKKDVECGVRFCDTALNFQPGDCIICFKIGEQRQVTDWNPPGF